jgi:transcriptional regulator with XRE-family HTH domain
MFKREIFCKRAIALFGETGQKELSSKTGISQAVISSIKTKSIKSPSADTIFLLANYFNVSTDWLLGLTDIKSTDKATEDDIYQEGYMDGYNEGYTYIVNQIKTIIK